MPRADFKKNGRNGGGARRWAEGDQETVRIDARLLPHSIEAEQGVLGSILLNGGRDYLETALARLGENAEALYVPAHQTIFLQMRAVHASGQAIDLITFTQQLRDANELDKVGGVAFVTALFTVVPSSANFAYYLDIVLEKHALRELIAACTEGTRRAYDEQTEPEEAILDTQGALTRLALGMARPDTSRAIMEGAEATIEWMKEAYKHRGQDVINGLATGFYDIDRMLSGIRTKNLVIIAARPSQGKSAIAMNIAEHVAVAQKIAVQVFSLEMSFQELSDRLVCSYARIPLSNLRTGFASDENAADGFRKVAEKIAPLATSEIYIDDTPSLKIAEFKVRAREARVKRKVGCIIVDYLQLMRGSESRRAMENRSLELAEITAELKAAAKELDIPIIVCAQLNRETEKSTYARPKLSHLRESGAIENDADIVLLLWRPCKAVPRVDWGKLAKYLEIEEEEVETYAELNIAKQRNGPTGDVILRFEGPLTRFENVTSSQWSNNPAERQTNLEDNL